MNSRNILLRAPTPDELLAHTPGRWMVLLRGWGLWIEALVQHPSKYSRGELTPSDPSYLKIFSPFLKSDNIPPDDIAECYPFNESPLDVVSPFVGQWMDQAPTPAEATAWWLDDKSHAWELMYRGVSEFRLLLRVGRDGRLRQCYMRDGVNQAPGIATYRKVWTLARHQTDSAKWRKIAWTGKRWAEQP